MLNHKDTKIKLQQKCLQHNKPIYSWCYPQIYIHKPEKEVSSLKALAVKLERSHSGWWLTGKSKFHGVYHHQPDCQYSPLFALCQSCSFFAFSFPSPSSSQFSLFIFWLCLKSLSSSSISNGLDEHHHKGSPWENVLGRTLSPGLCENFSRAPLSHRGLRTNTSSKGRKFFFYTKPTWTWKKFRASPSLFGTELKAAKHEEKQTMVSWQIGFEASEERLQAGLARETIALLGIKKETALGRGKTT